MHCAVLQLSRSDFSQLGKPGDRNAKLSANLRSNDHAFIIAGAEITKAARNWLGNKLDASKRSQLLFMDRDDILNLFVVTNLPLPPQPFRKRNRSKTRIHSSDPLYSL